MRTTSGYIPDELKSGTISIAEAQSLGVSRDVLRGPGWRRVGWGRYRWAGQGMDEDVTLAVLLTTLPEGAALAGAIAARRWGLDVPRPVRPDVIVPPGAGVSGRVEGRIRRVKLEPGDVLMRGGLPVTSPVRTCFDLACRLPLVEAVVAIDQALHLELVKLEQLSEYVARHHRIPGLNQARLVVDLAEPKAESPMESRLRMLLVREGLPRPQAQVSLTNTRGRSWDASIFSTPTPTLPLSTTARTTATESLPTTSARTGSSRPASTCCGTRRPISPSARPPWLPRSVRRSTDRGTPARVPAFGALEVRERPLSAGIRAWRAPSNP